MDGHRVDGSLSLDERLDRIESKLDEAIKVVTGLQVQVAILKVKAAFYGAGAGIVMGAAMAKLLGH